KLFSFSSRRRHTRFSRDWSSDVCSSDLGADGRVTIWHLEDETCEVEHEIAAELGTVIALSLSPADDTLALCAEDGTVELWDPHEIGRASRRERVRTACKTCGRTSERDQR